MMKGNEENEDVDKTIATSLKTCSVFFSFFFLQNLVFSMCSSYVISFHHCCFLFSTDIKIISCKWSEEQPRATLFYTKKISTASLRKNSSFSFILPCQFFLHNFFCSFLLYFTFISSCKLKYSYRGCDNSYIFVELTLTEIDIWVLFKKFTRSILFLIYRRSPRRFDISSRVDIE